MSLCDDVRPFEVFDYWNTNGNHFNALCFLSWEIRRPEWFHRQWLATTMQNQFFTSSAPKWLRLVPFQYKSTLRCGSEDFSKIRFAVCQSKLWLEDVLIDHDTLHRRTSQTEWFYVDGKDRRAAEIHHWTSGKILPWFLPLNLTQLSLKGWNSRIWWRKKHAIFDKNRISTGIDWCNYLTFDLIKFAMSSQGLENVSDFDRLR